ncbi:MAG: pectate lyase [Gemmataceae bacterium]
MRFLFSICFVACSGLGTTQAQDIPTRKEAISALNKAIDFFHSKVATHGGFVWKYSADLKYRQGEGLAYDQRIWIQPPGTPAVGLAFLQAYEATRNKNHLQAARDVADALVKGQLHSGGWYYSVTFDPEKRRGIHYRVAPTRGKPQIRWEEPGGWVVWRKRRHRNNMTTVDDDTTPAALRCLIRVDQALGFKDKTIHEAAEYGLTSLMKAQYPIGAWSHNYDRFPRQSPDPEFYPIKKASYPKQWSRKWTRDFSGAYVLNDRISLNAIKTMLLAHEVYKQEKYLMSAHRGGQFLLLAQMPDPQPAWAQQYDRNMQPVWDRPFEPPAITAFESQDVLETLLDLYQHTAQKKYLTPIPGALAYLERSKLKDGKLSRFYELQTNKPLFFTKRYAITYDRGAMPSHYRFVLSPWLSSIRQRYELLQAKGPKAATPSPNVKDMAVRVRKVIESLDSRGAWTEPGWVRNENAGKVTPQDGVILSETFIHNVELLSRYIQRTQ